MERCLQSILGNCFAQCQSDLHPLVRLIEIRLKTVVQSTSFAARLRPIDLKCVKQYPFRSVRGHLQFRSQLKRKKEIA